jgi:hypothetical protein
MRECFTKQEPRDKWTIALTAGLLAVTMVYTGMTFLQWRVTAQALKATQRPWVTAVRMSEPKFAPGKSPKMGVFFATRGAMPARNVTQCVFSSIRSSTPWWLPRCRHWSWKGSHSLWVEGLTYEVTPPLDSLSEAEIVEVTKPTAPGNPEGMRRFYVYGEVRYEDGFGDTHRSTFCARYVVDGNGARFEFCPDHNDAE